MKNPSWTTWKDIEKASVFEKGCYGIYKIRITNKSKKVIQIKRVRGIDKEGIVYIGRAKPSLTLARRIREFEAVADELHSAFHSGAITFFLMRETLLRYKHHKGVNLQYKVLRIDVKNVGSNIDKIEKLKEEIEKEEKQELSKYFSIFCELPPCNSVFTGKWEYFENDVKKRLSG